MRPAKIKSEAEMADEAFDAIYPRRYRTVSKFHFTPVHVAQIAAKFLAEKPGTRVLDVGSGAGKFCMAGAACTQGHFTGVEQRQRLFRLAVKLAKRHAVERVEFIHAQATEIDFGRYDAIYYFNSFFENLVPDSAIDQSVPMDRAQYKLYTTFMREQLAKMPAGTRLATYFSFLDEIPDTYKIQYEDFDLKLKLWEKIA